jgi:diguanylate cyclase
LEPTTRRGAELPRLVYPLRAIGLAAGFLCVAAVFQETGAHPLAWGALSVNAFVWPHLAYLVGSTRKDPYAAEQANLVADSALGGLWIPLMGFNLLPSVLLFSMLTLDKVSVGGPRLVARSWAAMAAAAALSAALFGFRPRVESSWDVQLACVPLLVIYPMLVGVAAWRMRRRIREQGRRLDVLLRTDALSGLATRQHWHEAVEREFARTGRSGRTASLVLLDLDDFKRVNDQAGHLAGDEFIRRAGRVMRESLRTGDLAGRYGGDEFAIVLPETGAGQAQAIAERIREALEQVRLDGWPFLSCTASLGIAAVSQGTPTPTHWIEAADQALYRAKEEGRNRVCAAA